MEENTIAGYRKPGRASNQRKALTRSQIIALLYHGRIGTTETRTREIRKVAEGLIAMAVKEGDSYEIVKVAAKVARKGKDGKRVKEVVDGKKVAVYGEVEKEVEKDMPSRLYARRQTLRVLYDVAEVPSTPTSEKKNIKFADMIAKLFDNTTPEYTNHNGGYTRIVKVGLRKGDTVVEVLTELV